MKFWKIGCPHCKVNLEFPVDMIGEATSCPKCGGSVTLIGGEPVSELLEAARETFSFPPPPPKPPPQTPKPTAANNPQPQLRPSSNEELKRLRSCSKYPTLRSLVEALKYVMYFLGVLHFIGGVVVVIHYANAPGDTVGTCFFIILLAVGMGLFCFLLGQVIFELGNLLIDGVDAILDQRFDVKKD